MAEEQDLRPRTGVPARAGADAGLHRRAGGGRPRRHARRHGASRRRSKENQSAGAGGSRHRPFGGGEFLRPQGLVQKERRGRVQAEPGTLPVPQMGAALIRRFPRGAARHRHLPSGQSRISVARGVEREGQDQLSRQVGGDGTRLSGHAGRHQFAHHHGQRAVGAWLGRRRHRGRGGDARPALLDGAARGDRRAAQRQAQGRRHRDRSRAHGDADAAQARRRRQIRRIFRPRPRQSHHRRPRHDRQHVARIRRDLRLLPGRRRYHPLPARHRPSRPISSRWSSPMPRRRACIAPRTRPIRCSPTCSSSNCPPSSRRSPGRSGRRTALLSRRSRTVLPGRWTRSSTRRPSWRSAFRSKARALRWGMATW